MIPPKYWSPTKKLMVLGAMAGGKLVEDTATGNPLTFLTDLAKPLKSLLIPFTPVQSGTGDPSPENVRSIIPWNGLTVWNGGKNLLDPSTLEQGGINADGVSVSNPKRIRTGYIPVKESTYYSLSAGSEYKAFMHFYDKDKGSIGGNTIAKAKAPAGACFVRGIIGYQDETNIVPSDCTTGQIEVVAQNGLATEYVPYVPITETSISFPSPVYGGTLDVVSGVLTVDTVCDTFIWGNARTSADLTNVTRKVFELSNLVVNTTTKDGKYCDKATFRNDYSADTVHFYTVVVNGTPLAYVYLPIGTPDTETVQICYPLATPQEIQLTPEQITALIGNNTIWSDADGSMTAVYLKKG